MFYDNPPDLVILNIMLPEMDGWEVYKEIRRFDKTPIIMLTGKSASYDKLKGFNLGTDDYLVKPFDPNELMARIKVVLRRAKLNSES
jgi:DNA-binding response OmpR family regulator